MPIPWGAIAIGASRGYAAFQVIEGIRQEFCQLYRSFPEATERIVGAVPGGGLINPFFPVICPSDPPFFPIPESPFNGGQCCGSYAVTMAGVIEGQTASATYTAQGKIGGLVWLEGSGTPEFISGGWYLEHGLDCPGATPKQDLFVGGQNLTSMPSASIVSIERTDGLPDDCGSPNPQFPRLPIPPDRLNFPISIDVGGQTISIPVSVSIPVALPDINIEPTINFNLPFGNIQFTLDGVNINFPGSPRPFPSDGSEPGTDFPDPRLPGDRPPPYFPPGTPTSPPGGNGGSDGDGGGDGGDCPDVNLEPVLRAIERVQGVADEVLEGVEELLDCERCAHPTAGECLRMFLGTGQGGTFTLPPRSRWVEVEIIARPENWKGFFNEGSPDVVYAGWLELGSSGLQGYRQQVQYEKNIAPVHNGFNSFSYGLQSGWLANAYTYIENESED